MPLTDEKRRDQLARYAKKQRARYAKDRNKYRQIKNRSRNKRAKVKRALLVEAKRVGCQDCKNEFRPWVLQFDHVRGNKLCNVTDMVWGFSVERIKEEISKCRVLCANCHSDKTHKQRKKKFKRGVAQE
jgi:hypothetical protein